MKKDRTRSILIIISIALTTLLLTAVSGAGYGIIRLQLVNAAELYGEFYGVYRDVTMESIEEMRRHAAFEEIGLSADYAEVDSDKTLILTCMDEKARAMSHTENAIVEGRYPEAEDEIAAAPMFFRQLGVADRRPGHDRTPDGSEINVQARGVCHLRSFAAGRDRDRFYGGVHVRKIL